jgi:hypothetical protein
MDTTKAEEKESEQFVKDVQALKKDAQDLVDLLCKGTPLFFDKVRRRRWGETVHKDGKDEIHLYYGENLERIEDKIDAAMYIDTVEHEIAHVLTDSQCTFHSHDKLWKEYAVKTGAIPWSSMTKDTYIIYVVKGLRGNLLGKPYGILKNILPNEKYKSIGIERTDRFNNVHAVMGNVLVKCSTCKQEWIRPKENVDYICPICKDYAEGRERLAEDTTDEDE